MLALSTAIKIKINTFNSTVCNIWQVLWPTPSWARWTQVVGRSMHTLWMRLDLCQHSCSPGSPHWYWSPLRWPSSVSALQSTLSKHSSPSVSHLILSSRWFLFSQYVSGLNTFTSIKHENPILKLGDTPAYFICQPRLGLRSCSPTTIYGILIDINLSIYFSSHTHREIQLTN